MERPRLRDNRGLAPFELYQLGQIPKHTINEFGKYFAYQYAVGKTDITGSEWGDIFAAGIGGVHLDSPLGIADVVYDTQCWSAKTVKHDNPHSQQKVRVISGRCSPDYSYGITDPHEDIQRTGTAVLSIFNERINIATDRYSPVRTVILIRNFGTFEFALFEHDIHRYVSSEYKWQQNMNGNLEGYDLAANRHCFTWQPHGSQFTVLYDVPTSVCRFKVRQPDVLDFNRTIQQIGYDESWVTIL